MARKMSISGMGSFVAGLFFHSAFARDASGSAKPMARNRTCGVSLSVLAGYVLATTLLNTEPLSFFRRKEMDRSARRVKRESNWVTAFSSRAKLDLMADVLVFGCLTGVTNLRIHLRSG
jgi:hypothetical protein